MNNVDPMSFEECINAAIGVHAVCGLCNFAGGALHLPIVKAVVKSDLHSFGKFLATAIIAGNALECFRSGSKEFHRVAELCIGPEKQEEKPAEEEKPDQTEDESFKTIYDTLHEVKNEE